MKSVLVDLSPSAHPFGSRIRSALLRPRMLDHPASRQGVLATAVVNNSNFQFMRSLARSRRTNFWILPVDVLGMEVKTNLAGSL